MTLEPSAARNREIARVTRGEDEGGVARPDSWRLRLFDSFEAGLTFDLRICLASCFGECLWRRGGSSAACPSTIKGCADSYWPKLPGTEVDSGTEDGVGRSHLLEGYCNGVRIAVFALRTLPGTSTSSCTLQSMFSALAAGILIWPLVSSSDSITFLISCGKSELRTPGGFAREWIASRVAWSML